VSHSLEESAELLRRTHLDACVKLEKETIVARPGAMRALNFGNNTNNKTTYLNMFPPGHVREMCVKLGTISNPAARFRRLVTKAKSCKGGITLCWRKLGYAKDKNGGGVVRWVPDTFPENKLNVPVNMPIVVVFLDDTVRGLAPWKRSACLPTDFGEGTHPAPLMPSKPKHSPGAMPRDN
jgi:hypothetical protein